MKTRVAHVLVVACAVSACHASPARRSMRTPPAASTRLPQSAPVAAWCGKPDLRPSPIGASSALAGARAYFLQARNVGGRPCRVKGFAVATQVLTAGARWRTVHVSRGTPFDGDLTASAYVLQPRDVAVVDLLASHAPGYRRLAWRAIRLRLPHVHGWIEWAGVIHPDSGVGLGPVRNSDR